MEPPNGVAIRCDRLHSGRKPSRIATNRAHIRAGKAVRALERVHSAHSALYPAELQAG
jgi:hypothetical protein